jgi:hypothetical protein
MPKPMVHAMCDTYVALDIGQVTCPFFSFHKWIPQAPLIHSRALARPQAMMKKLFDKMVRKTTFVLRVQ